MFSKNIIPGTYREKELEDEGTDTRTIVFSPTSKVSQHFKG